MGLSPASPVTVWLLTNFWLFTLLAYPGDDACPNALTLSSEGLPELQQSRLCPAAVDISLLVFCNLYGTIWTARYQPWKRPQLLQLVKTQLRPCTHDHISTICMMYTKDTSFGLKPSQLLNSWNANMQLHTQQPSFLPTLHFTLACA